MAPVFRHERFWSQAPIVLKTGNSRQLCLLSTFSVPADSLCHQQSCVLKLGPLLLWFVRYFTKVSSPIIIFWLQLNCLGVYWNFAGGSCVYSRCNNFFTSGHMAVRHPECKLTLFTHVAKEIMYLRNMEKCQCFFKLCEVKPTKQRDQELREINFQAVVYDLVACEYSRLSALRRLAFGYSNMT